MFIARISELFTANHIPFAIVGGYAVAIHGVARGTFDLDVITILTAENLVKIETALASLDMKSRLPIAVTDLFVNLEKFKRERNLVAWNFIHPTRVRDSLNIIITEDIRDWEITEVESDFGVLPTLSLESLIKMKSRLSREQDQKDVAALKLLRGSKS